ncbi:rCG52197, partial [Rattus norvegicus]
MTPPVTSGICL